MVAEPRIFLLPPQSISEELMTTRIFADGADLETILKLAQDERISGFTTNPTLMRRAGVTDYAAFAAAVLEHITDQPISFEVFADTVDEIRRQALLISRWGNNVYVKVPVTTTKGEPLTGSIRDLSDQGVKVNITAMFTLEQVEAVTGAVQNGAPSFLSIFAGRIADSGRDPTPLMTQALEIMRSAPRAECIWASPREILNLVQARSIGCHIITMTADLLNKIDLLGMDLTEFSLDTVRMFYQDAKNAGYEL
jgi:transaldolase